MDMAKLITAEASGAVRLGPVAPSASPSRGSEKSEGAILAPTGRIQSEARRDADREVEIIERLRNAADANSQARLQIVRDEDAGQFIYKFTNPETGETVRQWPPEDYLDLITYLREKQGGLVDRQA